MRKAVIDIGSNSIKFLVSQIGKDGKIITVTDRNSVTRLGEGLSKGNILLHDAIERSVSAVEKFYNEAVSLGCNEIKAVGTMALRNAENRSEFINAVKEKCKIEVEVISGEEEARLSSMAVLTDFEKEKGGLLIFDTGGGSTEFIFCREGKIQRKFSINLGAVKITEEYFKTAPSDIESVEEAEADIKKLLQNYIIKGQKYRIIGIGGTVTTMGAVKHEMEIYDPSFINGSVLTMEDVKNQIESYRKMTIDERRKIKGLNPKRAEVVLGGACILYSIMDTAGACEITISDRGLRHRLSYELFSNELSLRNDF